MDEGEEVVQKIRRSYRRLLSDRESWDTYWRDVKSFMCPGYGRFLTTSSGTEVNRGWRDLDRRVDGEAGRALGILASGIQSGLTSKARQWFLLQHPDPRIAAMHDVRVWYGQIQEILEGLFLSSNVYSALRNAYFEMAAFGQAVMSVTYDPDHLISCRTHTCGTYCLETNAAMEVDTVFLTEWLTGPQLIERFGEAAVGEGIVGASRSAGYTNTERYEVVNLVTKAPERYGLKPNGVHPVASVHFLNRDKSGGGPDGLLRQSGYYDFPFMCPRWDVIDNDVYGWAPSRDIMGDTKMLQQMQTDKLKGLAKIVTPPMRVPPEMERRGLNMRPGGINVVTPTGESAIAPLYTVGVDIQQVGSEIQAIRQSIRDGLYNSLFLALLMQDTPQMTATEVTVRNNEKMLMLGPVLERIHYELLNPLIVRAFGLAVKEGLIPDPPPVVAESGEPTKIEYVSILSQAQKAVGVSRIEQSVQFLGGLVQIAPEIRNLVDWKKLYETYNAMIGVREDIFRSDDEYQRIVSEEKRQTQMAQMAQSAQPLAESAKALSGIDQANIQQLLGGAGL